MPRQQNDPRADEIISTNADEIGDFWTKAVYTYAAPIVEANERLEPDPIGSAVRIRVARREYLATAIFMRPLVVCRCVRVVPPVPANT